MSAITIDIHFDAKEVSTHLQALLNKMDQREPFFRDVGELLLRSIKENFKAQKAPDGTPWTPLAPSTIKARRRGRKSAVSILRDRGRLMGSINYAATNDSVTIGAVPDYAAIHQLGGVIEKPERKGKIYRKQEKDGSIGRRFVKRSKANLETEVTIPAHQVKIPARPYLGVSKADEAAIFEAAERWLAP